ncbi:MAG: GNAT family N-acetyltransferase, partial [Chloroflexi bacterium]|nr:GNAT family N-acetyltransferase [Chloroflexota bacterium]
MAAGLITLTLDDPRWSRFVESQAHALPFHHPAWARFLAESFGIRGRVLASTDAAGRITAGLPVMDVTRLPFGRRWIALPLTDHCPVLGAAQPMDAFVDAVVEEARAQGVQSFEIRTPLPDRPPVRARRVAYCHDLSLSANADDLHARFKKMHQRNIATAEKGGVRIAWGTSERDVRAFYDLHLLTRRRQGVPIQPRRFFRCLRPYLLENGPGFVVSAHVDGAPVAAAVFLAWNGIV